MNNNRTNWIENLRVVSIIAVIIIHSCVAYGKLITDNSNLFLMDINIINSISRFCVPVFLMITGIFIFDERNANFNFFIKNRISKIIIPFIFWSIIYVFIEIIKKVDNFSLWNSFKITFSAIIGGAEYHLWYIYMLIGLYLIVPIVAKILKSVTEKEIKYYLILWIGFLAIAPLIQKINKNIEIRYFTGYLGYLIIGFYLTKYKGLKILNSKLVYFSLYIFGSLITIIGAWFSKGRFSAIYNFYDYLSLNVFLQSLGVLLIIKNLNINFEFMRYIAKHSFGIYFIHVAILNLIIYVLRYNNLLYLPNAVMIFLISFSCLSISFILIFLSKKIRFLKEVVD